MESISIQAVKDELKRLLTLYCDEAKEGDFLYWECAQDTILDVAAALNIPLVEELQQLAGVSA